MQSRLIGTDAGLNMIAEAGRSVVDTAVKSANAATSLTSEYLSESQRRAKQLLDLQSQLDATKAQRKNNNGFADAVGSIGQLLIQREQEKAKELAKTEEMNSVLKGTRLRAAIDTNQQQKKAQAELQKQQQEEQQLILRGDVEARLTSLYQSEPGVERYRSAAAGIISQAIDQGLSPKDTVELMRIVNETASKRYDSRSLQIQEEQQKLQDARTDQVSGVLQVKLQDALSRLANLPPTEQSAPHLAYIENLIKETIADQSLTPEQRYRITASALGDVKKAFGSKADAYYKQNTNLYSLGNYVNYMRQARAQFEADGNLDAYNYRQEYARTKFGNWENAIAQPGEAEKLQAQIASDINTRERIRQEALERVGINLDIGEQETQMLAKRMLTNPAYLLQMESAPEFKNNRSMQAAITLAKRYEEYTKDKAELENWKAANGVKYANLNLSVANNRAQFIESMARITAAASSGKQITPEQQAELDFNSRVLQNMPELQYLVDSMVQKLNSGGKIDPNELKKAADLSEQGLVGVMNATIQEQKTREQTIIDKYADLQQYGMLKSRDLLTKEAIREQKQLDERVEQWRQMVQQQSQQYTQPTQYGQQSPFDSSSTFGADVDARGLVRVAPRQRLNTITVGNTKVVTPVVSSASAPLTSGFQAPRGGGRKHAGVDFGANTGVYSVALVSGQVLHIGNDAEGYGGYMDILGDNGYVYRYGHQGNFKFKPGQRVRAGDMVSMSDGSGAGAPHLHFEVHTNPKFTNGNYTPSYGISATIDPIEHLKKISANESSVLQPRVNNRAVARYNPRVKVPMNAAVYPQGAALMANNVQFIGSQTRVATNVYNSQRPVRNGTLPWNIGNINNISYDADDDFGYSQLRNNTNLRRAITSAAKELRVPAVWIADIIRQETGASMSHSTMHNGGSNYGLFGFGNDSFRDVKVAHMRRMDETQQMQLMVRYMKENGWLQHLNKRGGEASISEFWAIMRMGTNWRRKALADPVGFLGQRMNDTGKTWADELGLLGKWAGRKYSLPGKDRRARNSAITTDEHASCKLCQQMLLSGSNILAHAHDIIT